MANRYDVRNQYESAEFDRNATLVDSITNIVSAGLDITEKVYEYNVQNQQMKAQKDFNDDLPNLARQMADREYDYTQKPISQMDGTYYVDGNPYTPTDSDTIQGNVLTTRTRKDPLKAYEDKNSFLDGYLAESGMLEGKGSAYKEAYTQLFDDWKASDIKNRTDDLIVSQRQENLSLVQDAFTDISSRMGDGSSSERFASELKNLSDGDMKYDIPEVTDEVGSDGYALQTMERDYWTARNLQYYTLRREYTEAEADRVMESTAVSSAMAFDYNSSPDVIDSYIRKNPNLDPTLYVESRLEAFSQSPLLEGRTLTAEEADMYRSSMKTLVSQRMDVFEREVAQAADSVLSDFSKANAEGSFFSYDDIEDALSGAFEGLGTSYDTASGYLDPTTRSNIATLQGLALENGTARTAYEAAQALNGSEADAIAYATKQGFTTNMGDPDVAATQARRYTWSMLSTEQKAYLHDNVYTARTEYTFAIPTSKAKEGLPGYVYTLAKENGIQDTDTLNLNEGLAYHASNIDSTYSDMVQLYGDRAWLEAMKDSLESGNLSGDMDAYVKVLMGDEGVVGDYFKSVGEKADGLGVDMSRPSTIDNAIAYIDSQLDSLANSAAESSTFIRNSSADPTYVSMTKDEFKTKAKGEKSVQEYSNLIGADWSNVNAGMKEYLSNEWIGNEASILTYKYTGQADGTLLKAMETYGTDDPDTAVTKLMRRDGDISKVLGGEPYSSRLDSLKENLSARLEENVGGTLVQIYAWEEYGATTSDSPIFRAAVDELYAQCREKPEETPDDYADKVYWLKYNTAKDGRYDDVEGQVLKSIQTTGDRIASEAKDSLLRFRAVDRTAYDAGVKYAEETMESIKANITERRETGIDDAVGKANLMASAGMDVVGIKQTMVFYGMDEEDANKVASTAYSSSYGEDGIAKIGGLANIDPVKGAGVEKLANSAVKDLVNGMSDETKTSVSRRYATSLTALLIEESKKGEAADYEKVIAEFQSGVVQNQLDTAFIGYGIASQEFYSTNKANWDSGYDAKRLRLDRLPFVQNYADGGYAATLYSQWLDGAPDTDSNRLLATYSTDTSLSDSDRQKYSLAFGYNAYTNTETFKAADVADMSYKDVVNMINGLSNDPQKRDVSDVLTLGCIKYGAGEALKSLVSVAPQYPWLELGRTLGQTGVDGTQLMQSVRFTGDGYVFEVQAANGKTVYCKPTFEDGKVKSDGWTFYRDEKLTDQIYSGTQYGFSGLTESQLDDLDMTTAIYGERLTYDILDKAATGTLFSPLDDEEKVKEGLSKMYVAKLSDGSYVSETIGDLMKRRPWDYDFSDIKVNDEVKGMLTRNLRQMNMSQSTNGYTSLYAISIADGSFKSSNAKYLSDSNRNGQTIRDDAGNVYTLTDDGLSPTLTKTVDVSKERLYWSYATEIASRSNGRVSIDDAYSAVLECYEGFDKPVVYMDSKGVCTTYYPTIYDYIRRGWYL